jgi:ABC-type polar amino acid transport system ATPase subunit
MEKYQQTNAKTKPNLIVFDEVDGALESESRGAVNAVLEFVFNGKRSQDKKP